VNLPEGRYFVQDIIGARVQDANTGEDYGSILSVSSPGRHEVYEIEHADGKRSLFPAVQPFLVKLDIENSLVLIAPIEGMLDGEAPIPKQKEASL
jgi:16S rRNA processing protein RimM